MREILITSSALILALLVLRRVFRQKISRRVQYALWGLVLVRLLVPVSLPALDFSVLTMAEPVQETISARLEAPVFTAPVAAVPNVQPQRPQTSYPKAVEPSIPGTASAAQTTTVPAEAPAAAKRLSLTEILGIVWLTGAAVMTVWLLASNLRFAVRLRRSRVPVNISGCKYPVYMVESGLASPCLFGVVKPAIYLTPAACRSEGSLRHVLAHEETHARHLDPLWALLRGVCLAVYWFDPLVWIAASAAKTDCELACDEGAIRRLGEGERLAYGRTLLSLIPVRRMPGNPLLSATTMSSDKKRLRDRVTRIAENRQTRKLALLALAALMTATCVFTFAGCAEKAKDDPDRSSAPSAVPEAGTVNAIVPREDGPLTAAELWYFNESFFNGNYANIHNQFLSSMYDEAADIDLFELFYTGIGAGADMSDGERDAYEAVNGFVDCDIVKLTPAGIDKALLENTGLTLEEADKASLESGFTYLPEYDAYYNGHGDTNYRGQVDIAAGERKDGLLRLYYNDTFYCDGWKCVSLRETESGYQFVSNAYCEKPVLPTVYPTGEAELTIPLADKETSMPYTHWQNKEYYYHYKDCEEVLSGPGKSVMVGDHQITTYRSTDGHIYVAEVLDGGADTWKARFIGLGSDSDSFYLESFDDIFGWQGFMERYTGDVEGAYQSFQGINENGDWYDLIHVPGYGMDCRSIDLDGDGVTELLCTDSAQAATLCYQKDGKIYSEDIAGLLKEAWPEAEFITFDPIQPYARYLSARAVVPAVGENGQAFQAVAFRNIYFDGGNLLVYKPDQTAEDHLLYGVSGPADVVDVLRREVRTELENYQKGNVDVTIGDADYDDWRITSLSGPYYERFTEDDGTVDVEIYRFGYELHAAAPEKVVIAGDMYIDEDGWFCPGYSNCDYLYFLKREDGSRKYLFRMMENDCRPGDELFRADLYDCLWRNGVLKANPGQQVQLVWEAMREDGDLALTLQTSAGGGTYSASLGWNAPYDLTSDYTWERLEEAPALTRVGYLTAYSPASNASLSFHFDTQFVSCTIDHETSWYRVEYTGQEDVFGCEMFELFRRFYDEAESTALHDQVTVPNDGRSHLEIAQTWADAYEKASLDLTSGSKFKCTYAEARDVELVDFPRENYPSDLKGRGSLLVSYSPVFVPEGEPHWFMAGNTAEYEGNDAPAGALQRWMYAYLYYDEGIWRCYSVGTGP